MNKQKRSYLEMQLEEATLSSGRYNADYREAHNPPAAGSPLLEAYRKAATSLGIPVRKAEGQYGPAGLTGDN